MIEILTDQQTEDLLKDSVLGHLGCHDGFNSYVYPINYLYDGQYILCHSQQGFKVEVMRESKRICLLVEEVQNHKHWKSVMVHGEYQELFEEQERFDAIKAFADRRMFLKQSEPTPLPDTNKQEESMQVKNDSSPAIFRIVIDEKTGRFENG